MAGISSRLVPAPVVLALLFASPIAVAQTPFAISLEGKDGGPLVNVRLSLANRVSYVSDGNGQIHFYEPGAMNHRIRFNVQCPEHPMSLATSDPPGLVVGPNTFTMEVTEGGAIAITDPTLPGSVCSTPPNPYDSLSLPYVPQASDYFRIRIVDAETGRGVPLAEVRSPNRIYVSDSNGEVAFYEPDLMGETGVPFEIATFGYELPGGNAVSLDVASGALAEFALERISIAERIYRATGAGIYRDSWLLGLPGCSPANPPPCIPLAEPLLNGEVLGQDTVQSTVHDGKIFWAWGDTRRLGLGSNTRVTAAISQLEENGGLSPEIGTDYAYFEASDGIVRSMAPPCAAPLPSSNPQFTWLLGLFSLFDAVTGQDRLFTSYLMNKIGVGPVEYGILSFEEAGLAGCSTGYEPPGVFTNKVSFGPDDAQGSLPVANGQAFQPPHTDGEAYFYFNAANTPKEGTLRVRATEADIQNPAAWEVFTPILPGTEDEIDRDEGGAIRYAWRTGSRLLTDAVTSVTAAERLTGHTIEPDPAPADPLYPGAVGTIAYNEYRGRFVRIMQEVRPFLVAAPLYAEADTPMGPWVYARRVAEHGNKRLYQPRMHPFLSREGGRILFFDGTYWDPSMPRYDYNQLRHELDLADPRLVMPIPLYDLKPKAVSLGSGMVGVGEFVTRNGLRPSTPDQAPALYAHDRATPEGIAGGVPIHWSGARCAGAVLLAGEDPEPLSPPVFYGVDPAEPGGDPYVTLYRHTHATGVAIYNTSATSSGFATSEVMVKVWKSPTIAKLPVSDTLALPVADAGSDRCAHVADAGSTTGVRVSGAGTRAGFDLSLEAAQALDYRWHDWSWQDGRGSEVANGIAPVIEDLGPGVHTFELVVTDPASSKQGSDFVSVEVAVEADADGDGVPDFRDNCTLHANPSQLDVDEDGFGNRCDGDLDHNGVSDILDAVIFCDVSGVCPGWPGNPSYLPEADFDGSGAIDQADYDLLVAMVPVRPGPSGLACAESVRCLDPVADTDLDGIPNGSDNCTARANADQRDTNGDGYGNACDADYDADGDVDDNDFEILAALFGSTEGDGVYEPDVDLNGDGVIGGPDFARLGQLYGKPPGPSGVSW